VGKPDYGGGCGSTYCEVEFAEMSRGAVGTKVTRMIDDVTLGALLTILSPHSVFPKPSPNPRKETRLSCRLSTSIFRESRLVSQGFGSLIWLIRLDHLRWTVTALVDNVLQFIQNFNFKFLSSRAGGQALS
jgi:hypothetical protein